MQSLQQMSSLWYMGDAFGTVDETAPMFLSSPALSYLGTFGVSLIGTLRPAAPTNQSLMRACLGLQPQVGEEHSLMQACTLAYEQAPCRAPSPTDITSGAVTLALPLSRDLLRWHLGPVREES